MQSYLDFLVRCAADVAVIRANAGPAPYLGQCANEAREYLAKVALLAQGYEPGCHDGSTFSARREAAVRIVAAGLPSLD